MSTTADQLSCVAKAEKYLSEHAGPLVARIIKEIDNLYSVNIAEIRMRVNPSEIEGGWGGINCVIAELNVMKPGRVDGATHVSPATKSD